MSFQVNLLNAMEKNESNPVSDSYENITIKVEIEYEDNQDTNKTGPAPENPVKKKRKPRNKLYKCPSCEYSSPDQCTLKVHVRKHTGEKPLKCEDCCYQTAHPSALKKHQKSHTGDKPFACDVCDYTSPHASALKKHCKIHIKMQPIQSDSKTDTPSTQKVSTIEKPASNVSKRPYNCSICDYKAAHPSSLKRHLTKHSGEKPHQCEMCSKKFMHAKSLKLHLLTHSGEQTLQCEFCQFSTVHTTSFKQHVLIHTGEKPFACDICDFKTAYAYALKGHIRTHTGDKPYKCDKCDYQTAYHSHLRKHLIRHAGLKPHKCQICDFQCMHLKSLKRHILTHTGEKPFACTLCTFKSTHSEGLKEHFRTHTGEKPYKCDKCDYRCARKSNIKKHRRTHTKVKGVGRQSIKIIDETNSGDFKDMEAQPEEGLHEYDMESINPNYINPIVQIHITEERENILLETEIKIEPIECTESTDPMNSETPYTNESNKIIKLEIESENHIEEEKMHEFEGERPLEQVDGKMEDLYECDFCNFKTEYSLEFKDHLKTHSVNKP